MFFHDTKVYKLNYNLPSKVNKTSELPSEVNKLNSNLPNKTNKTSEMPTNLILICSTTQMEQALPENYLLRQTNEIIIITLKLTPDMTSH